MYVYRYYDDEKLNKLLMEYTSEFDVTYIGKFKGKHVFSEFGKLYSASEKSIAFDLRKHKNYCGYDVQQ